MKKSKIIKITLLLLLLIGIGSWYYIFNCGARDLATENATFKITSVALCDEFKTNENLSNKKYLEKAVQVSGIVTSCSQNEVIIDTHIICSLKNQGMVCKMGEEVIIKGRVVGYDDLMGEVKLDQCFKN